MYNGKRFLVIKGISSKTGRLKSTEAADARIFFEITREVIASRKTSSGKKSFKPFASALKFKLNLNIERVERRISSSCKM